MNNNIYLTENNETLSKGAKSLRDGVPFRATKNIVSRKGELLDKRTLMCHTMAQLTNFMRMRKVHSLLSRSSS